MAESYPDVYPLTLILEARSKKRTMSDAATRQPKSNGFYEFMLAKKDELNFRGSLSELANLVDAEWRGLNPEQKNTYKRIRRDETTTEFGRPVEEPRPSQLLNLTSSSEPQTTTLGNEGDDEKRQLETIGLPSLPDTVTSDSSSPQSEELEASPLLVTQTTSDLLFESSEPQPDPKPSPLFVAQTTSDPALENREPEPDESPLLVTQTPNDSPQERHESFIISMRHFQPLPVTNHNTSFDSSPGNSMAEGRAVNPNLKYREGVTAAWLDHCFETAESRNESASSSSSGDSLETRPKITVASIYIDPEWTRASQYGATSPSSSSTSQVSLSKETQTPNCIRVERPARPGPLRRPTTPPRTLGRAHPDFQPYRLMAPIVGSLNKNPEVKSEGPKAEMQKEAETTEVAGSTVTPRQSAVAVRNLSAEFVADEAERSCNLPQSIVEFDVTNNPESDILDNSSVGFFFIGGIGHGPLQDTLSVGARTAIRTKLEFTLRQLTKMLNKLDVEEEEEESVVATNSTSQAPSMGESGPQLEVDGISRRNESVTESTGGGEDITAELRKPKVKQL